MSTKEIEVSKPRRNSMYCITALPTQDERSTEVSVKPPRPLGIDKMLVLAHKLQTQLPDRVAIVAVCKRAGRKGSHFLRVTFLRKIQDRIAQRMVQNAFAEMVRQQRQRSRSRQLAHVSPHRLVKCQARMRMS